MQVSVDLSPFNLEDLVFFFILILCKGAKEISKRHHLRLNDLHTSVPPKENENRLKTKYFLFLFSIAPHCIKKRFNTKWLHFSFSYWLMGRSIYNGNWTEWSAIWAEIIRVIWNHKYDFRPKLHDTRFNYHFITSILKSPKCRTWSIQIFYWCSTEPVFK